MATNLPSSSLIIFLILKQLVFLIILILFPCRYIQAVLRNRVHPEMNLFGWNRSGTFGSAPAPTFFKRIAAFKSSIANNNHYSFYFLQLLTRLLMQKEWK